MLQFTSPRARMFHKRRRFRLRHLVFTAAALGTIYAAASLLSATDHVAAVETIVADVTPVDAMMNDTIMAAAGVTHPPAPSHTFDTGEDVANTPAILIPARKPVLVEKIASLHSGISNMLQSGSDLFVSQRRVMIGKGDTLMELLVKNNVPRGEAYSAIQALSKLYNPRALRPNHEITVFFHQDPAIADPKFSGLQIRTDTVNSVVLNRTGDGSYRVQHEEKETHRTVQGFRGDIDGSLYVAARAQGVPDAIILDMIKMYSFTVDFQRDIQKGDAFEVMYEEYVTADGEPAPGRAQIIYAQLKLDGRDLPFYRFKDKDDNIGYYDPKGQGTRKTLMSTPIDGARLSSGFGMRKHPVLGYGKMHRGIDFAAPRGTPIYAAGDGTIRRIGPFGSYGNYVRIRHAGGIDTAYAHMNGFKSGLKSGSRVKQGQVIGYVGTTGRSTGPHLHYEVILNGKHVNPRTLRLPTGKALAGKDLSAFKAEVARIDRQFREVGTGIAIADAGSARKRTAARK